MKKLLILAAVIAAGHLGYLEFTGGLGFGVSSESPVGTLHKLDRYLAAQQLRRTLPRGEETRIVEYADAAMTETSGCGQSVHLILGPGDQVRGVGGVFTSSGGSIKVKDFLLEMWRQAGGGEPTFERASAGAGVLSRPLYVASFSTPDAEGRWIRHDPSELVQIASRR